MSTLFDAVREQAAKRPGRTAIRESAVGARPARVTTYAELFEQAGAFARVFEEWGCPVVPLFLDRGATAVAAMLGAIGAGSAFAFLNPRLRGPQVAHVLEATGARLAVVDATCAAALVRGPADERLGVPSWWFAPGASPLRQRALAALAELAEVTESPPAPRSDTVASARLPAADEPAGCVLFTSGSTGVAKGVVVGARDLARRATGEADWYSLVPEDVLLGVLPFSFDVGLNQLCSALTAGCELVLLASWLPADVLAVSAAHGVTGISAVPSIWSDVLRAGMCFETAGAHASLRYLTLSGGDLGPKDLERLGAMAPGAGVFKTYGQTEAFRATSLRPDEFADRARSVGRALPGVHVYVVREDGALAAPGEEGEVVHTGAGTMLGYLGLPDAAKLRSNPFQSADDPATRAVFTGDRGSLDEAGYLRLTGRHDDMLKVAGNRVYPQEVAEAIREAGAAEAVEVVGGRTPEGEPRLVAFMVCRGTTPPDERMLLRRLSTRLPSYMMPARAAFLAAVPRTPHGKPDRRRLTELANRLLSE